MNSEIRRLIDSWRERASDWMDDGSSQMRGEGATVLELLDELEALLAAEPPPTELEQERTRLWDAIIAVDAIEHRHSLENSGDLAERIERIGAALDDAKVEARPTEETAADALTRYCAICYHPLTCSHCDPAAPQPADPQPHSCEWKDAVIDACVVDWIFTKEHETNPRKAINDLLCWQQTLALDPTISEAAAKLHNRIAELERASHERLATDCDGTEGH